SYESATASCEFANALAAGASTRRARAKTGSLRSIQGGTAGGELKSVVKVALGPSRAKPASRPPRASRGAARREGPPVPWLGPPRRGGDGRGEGCGGGTTRGRKTGSGPRGGPVAP